MSIEVIMDGRIFDENLQSRGLDVNWLQQQLGNQGYQSAKDVFLGICDSNNQLVIFQGQ